MPYEPEWLDAKRHPISILLPGDILWTEGLKRGGFGRASITGTGVVPEWLQSPKTITNNFTGAASSTHVYWVSTQHTTTGKALFWLSRCSLLGTLEAEWFSLGEKGLGSVRGIATDGTYAYVYHGSIATSKWYIGRLHIGTKAWEPEWITPLEEWKGGGFNERGPGYALAVGAGFIFWQVPGGIARARLSDGGGINENWTQRNSQKALGGTSPTGWVQSLYVSGEYVWAGTAGLIPHVYRVRLDGSAPELIPLPTSKPLVSIHVAADDVYLYWDWEGNFIGRWSLDEIVTVEIPESKEEKEAKEKKEEEEKGGGTGKEEEEEAEKGEEKETKEKEEEEDKKRKEKEQKEKEEREKQVEEEEEREEKEKQEEGGGIIVPPPPPPNTGAIVVPGIVRFGRPRE